MKRVFAFIGVAILMLTVVSVSPAAASHRSIGIPRDLVTLPPSPEGLAVGPDGNLYAALISLGATAEIVVVDPEGEIVRTITVAHGPGASQANLLGEVFDGAGNLYVCDAADVFIGGAGGRVIKISPDGDIQTLLAGLIFPNGLAFDRSRNLYVSDSIAAKIWKITPEGSSVLFSDSDLLRNHTAFMGLPIGVNGIAFTRGDTSLVAVNTADGTVISIPVLDDGTAGTAFVIATGLVGADGVALDVKQNIYVAVNVANQIAVLSPSGTLLATYGAGGDPLRNPASLVFIGRTLYLTDLAFFIPGATPGLSKMAVRFPGLPLSSPGDDGNHEES